MWCVCPDAESIRTFERGDLKRLDNLRRSLDIMTKQMSIQDAAKHFNVSDRTIRRWIKSGRLYAQLINGKYCVDIELTNHLTSDLTDDNVELVDQLRSEVERMAKLLERKDEQTDHLQQLLAVSQKSIQQLTEQNQFLLEDTRRRTWWKRIFRR